MSRKKEKSTGNKLVKKFNVNHRKFIFPFLKHFAFLQNSEYAHLKRDADET
jgi:hypothetical protein